MTTDTTDLRVLCIHQEMGETFVHTVDTSATNGVGSLSINGTTAELAVLAGDPRVNPGWEEEIKSAEGLLLLVRFMDVISMDKVKAIFRNIPSEPPVPMVVVIFREEGETDFKMSCSACGQKLWVRDQDVGKRGRCPNCKRAFRLPAQDEHIKSQLMVPDAVPIMIVDRGSVSTCVSAVTKLVELLTGDIISDENAFDPEVLKQTTMRIQVGGTKPGDTTASE